MIIHNIKLYRERKNVVTPPVEYDFSDSQALVNNVVINEAKFDGELRTEVKLSTVKNGGTAGTALGSPRLFTFRGQVFGKDRLELSKGQDFLRRALGLGVNFGKDTFKMTFTLDNYDETEANPKVFYTWVEVYKLPTFTTTDNDLVVNFEFELISESFEYKLDRQIVLTDSGTGVGTSFTVNLENPGTGLSPVMIEVTGSSGLTNPKVKNNTIGNYYKVNDTATGGQEVVFDFRTTGEPDITINGVDKRFYRASGSTSVFLSTGINELEIISDTAMGNVTFTLTLEVNYI